MTTPTRADIALRLLALSEEMREVAVLMDYYCGISEMAKHAAELYGAANIAAQWSEQIKHEH